MKKLKSPSLGSLLLTIFILCIIYFVMMYAVTNRGEIVVDNTIWLSEVGTKYEIPRILISDETECEFTENGLLHIYNEYGEILIDKEGETEDVLSFIDENDDLVSKELTSYVTEETKNNGSKCFSNIKVREYDNDNGYIVSVSYKQDGVSFGFVLLEPESNEYIVNCMVDQVYTN